MDAPPDESAGVVLHQGLRACIESGRTDCMWFHPELAMTQLQVTIVAILVLIVILRFRSHSKDDDDD